MKDNVIIMDTNVLFAGLHSSTGASFQILKRLNSREIKSVISTPLLFEYEDVLKREQTILDLSHHQVDVILDNICVLSDFQDIFFLWRPYLKDPKDDHVLEVAIASKTKTIITHNIKDFREIEKFGIKAITPGKYLEAIK